MRTTDEVIAAKDREIRKLNERLEEQIRNAAAKTSETASAELAMSQDAALREEREKLKQLQVDWQEKIQQAEVELALERAKMARQRAELEGHDRTAEDAAPEPPTTIDADGQAKPSARGRWLARLGLTDADREPARHS